MVGYYDDITFQVDRICGVQTFSKLSETAAGSYADISLISGKPRKQHVGAALQSVSLDILLRGDLGGSPRERLGALKAKTEAGVAGYLVIGERPVTELPLVIKSLSADWGAVYSGGEVFAIKVSLTLEEYR